MIKGIQRTRQPSQYKEILTPMMSHESFNEKIKTSFMFNKIDCQD